MKWIKHFKTISYHKWIVMKHCFRVGLYWQGITHDLSKYTPSEFLIGVKYYQGDRSPNNAERELKGYSSAWLHHKGRNKHHLEYWIDYSMNQGATMEGCEMPVKYVIEMFCDRVAACKVYNGEDYADQDPLMYFEKSKDHYLIHQNTRDLLESLLMMLSEKGEDETFLYIRKRILKK